MGRTGNENSLNMFFLLSPPRPATAEVTVNVENLNDNTPVFVQDGVPVIDVNVTIQEEMDLGSLVFTLEVSHCR